MGVERPARLARHQLQRVEAVQHAAAQGVHAADQRRIGQPRGDQPVRLREYLRARRTGGRHRHARAARAGERLHERAERMHRVHDRPRQLVRKARAFGRVLQSGVGLLAGADAGGGGAQHQRHAFGTVARDRGAHRVQHAILLQRDPGQAVVAALVSGERRRQRRVLDALDAADPAFERTAVRLRPEVVRAQPAAACRQRFELRRAAAAEGGGAGPGAHGQWRDRVRQGVRHTGLHHQAERV